MDSAFLSIDSLKVEKVCARFEVRLDELFCETFMIANTDVASISEFFYGGGFYPTCVKEIEEIPRAILDFYILQHSLFSSWHEMLENAVDAFLLRMEIYA